ncbi:YdcF family protein [Paenibacillus sp. Leaf72]|uniref:YdcF family protein n=1 Tax=Paenibacillus sp. Leaf72 TaxID=1736234 RepID=UPI0007C80967|nr:YdcF family protein [Paenibacillus sp. Leaf72]
MKQMLRTRSSRRKRRTNKRPGLLLFRMLAWCIVAGVFWCGYVLWVINSYNAPKEREKADVGIVLGAALWDNVPSPALKERLNLAYKLYEQGKVDKLIMSGGLDAGGAVVTEAAGMKTYLVNKGIPEDKVLLEDKSTSTYENLLFSKTIMEREGFASALIITHQFHAPRALEIAQFLNYASVEAEGTPSQVLKPWNAEGREVLAYTKWKLDALMLWLG